MDSGGYYSALVVDVRIRTTAVGWESTDFPGWLELVLFDVAGREHRIVEKHPVLSTLPLLPTSPFPMEMWIHATMVSMNAEEVVVSLSHGVETTNGLSDLTLSAVDVIWL